MDKFPFDKRRFAGRPEDVDDCGKENDEQQRAVFPGKPEIPISAAVYSRANAKLAALLAKNRTTM